MILTFCISNTFCPSIVQIQVIKRELSYSFILITVKLIKTTSVNWWFALRLKAFVTGLGLKGPLNGSPLCTINVKLSMYNFAYIKMYKFVGFDLLYVWLKPNI